MKIRSQPLLSYYWSSFSGSLLSLKASNMVFFLKQMMKCSRQCVVGKFTAFSLYIGKSIIGIFIHKLLSATVSPQQPNNAMVCEMCGFTIEVGLHYIMHFSDISLSIEIGILCPLQLHSHFTYQQINNSVPCNKKQKRFKSALDFVKW